MTTKTLLLPIILIIGSIITLSSCRSSYRFDTLKPAPYTLPKSVDTILIANCVPSTIWSDTSKFDKKLANDIVNSEKHLPKMLCTMASTTISQDMYLYSKIFTRSISLSNLCELADTICSTNNCDAILALRDLEYKVECDTTIVSNTLNETHFYVEYKAQWCMVFPNGIYKDLDIIADTTAFNDLHLFLKNGEVVMNEYYDNNIVSQVNPMRYAYLASEDIADNLSAQLTPAWETKERTLFYTPCFNFQSSLEAIKNNDWEKARATLYSIYEKDRTRNKIRAALDLSLSFEREDNIKAALIWCFKAQDLIKNNKSTMGEYAKDLSASLEKRLAELKKLDKQMQRK
ncbi:MAG: DUF6340 family protein [Bacteroidia bacterium]|nr:DUF6340 family protein [Bacteroidia bacterium]